MKQILLVDDNQSIKQMMEIAFGDEPEIDFHFFVSGGQVLEYLEDNHEDVDSVILDLAMPILDGLQVTEEIRRNESTWLKEPPVKIAFWTGSEIDPPVKRVAKRTHVEKFFKKPVDVFDFVAEVKQWMEI